MKLTRRDTLKLSGLALGGLALGSGLSGCPKPEDNTELEVFPLDEELAADEMRITFLGTSCIPRIAQECNSIFVETGSGDNFIFDCGSGVSAKYIAMRIPYWKMDKVFLTHLHGDHTSDIITIYCFGPSIDRKTPLRVWGPTGNTDDEGTKAFCDTLQKLMKWHIESFSFLPTGLEGKGDGYDIEATELPYMTIGGPAYSNAETGVTITHFPAVHCRDGSISYKLEWNGLSMVFTGDTKPNNYVIQQAQNVDVLIHEMVVPPEVWAAKNSGMDSDDENWEQALRMAQAVQDSSHTPQKALGYIFSQTNPRLGVATHFQADEDTIEPAMNDIRTWYQGPVAIARDLLVINVSKDAIRQRRAVVSDSAWYAPPKIYSADELAEPTYHTPTEQLNEELLGEVIDENLYDPE